MLLWALGLCLKTISVKTMPTVSQLFGLSPSEHAAATFTSLGEAGPGRDLYGPYATLLNRKLQSNSSLVNLASAPGQFVANAGRTAAQISDPSFGRKVYGSRYDQAYNSLNDPSQVAPVYNQLNGATSFRGQALLKNRKSGDVMLDPKGNFYFDFNQAIAKRGNSLLRGGTHTPTTTASVNQQGPGGNTYNFYLADRGEDEDSRYDLSPEGLTNKLLAGYVNKIQGGGFDPMQALIKASMGQQEMYT